MRDAFTSIIVPLDFEPDHERAVAAAADLAAIGNLAVVLVTVSSPGLPDLPDEIDLRKVAERHGLHRWSGVVLHDNDPARAVNAHVSSLDAPLVVMASSARGLIGELNSADVTADVLATSGAPVLVLGPKVLSPWHSDRPQLVHCLAPGASTDLSTEWAAAWIGAFGAATPHFVTVEPVARDAADSLPDWTILHHDNPVDALATFVADIPGSVLVVTSQRWSDDSRFHLHSIARQLAHDSSAPVLVLPSADE